MSLAILAGLLAFQQIPLNVPVGPQPGPQVYDASEVSDGTRQYSWITASITLEGGDKMPVPPLIENLCGAPLKSTWTTIQIAYPACFLRVSVPGFRTQVKLVQNGTVILLRRLGDHEGSSVSLTVLQSPRPASKAYDAGRLAALKHDWPAAAKHFEEAVRIYPKHANAWDQLGLAQEALSRLREARESFETAHRIDPRFIRPDVHLAKLALTERRPADAMAHAADAIALTPVEFPEAYLYHAMGAASLEQWDVAEASVKQAVKWDNAQEYPRAEYLWGTLLQRKGDRAAAAEHYRQYLARMPKAVDAEAVRQRIAKLE